MAPKSQNKRARVTTSEADPQLGTGMESLTVIVNVVLHSLGQSDHDVIFASLSFISIVVAGDSQEVQTKSLNVDLMVRVKEAWDGIMALLDCI